MRRFLQDLFYDTWQQQEDNSLHHVQTVYFSRFKIILILIYTALGLSIVKYFGKYEYSSDLLGDFLSSLNIIFDTSAQGRFNILLFWISIILIFYLLIPFLIISFVFKEKLSEYGFRLSGFSRELPMFFVLVAFMLPLVFFASGTKSFQDRYPIFQPDMGNVMPLFFYWQVAYFFQFVAVEFFFRGFILHGLKNRFGIYSVFVMTVPYCMVHFGKPFGETIAAIAAGVVLGFVSLRSKSIFLGIIVHYTVAITMDLTSLWREGFF